MDAACYTVRWIYAPMATMIFGIMQLQYGPHLGPAMLTPVLAMAVCHRVQKYQDAQFGKSSCLLLSNVEDLCD